MDGIGLDGKYLRSLLGLEHIAVILNLYGHWTMNSANLGPSIELFNLNIMMTIELLSKKKASIWHLANLEGRRCNCALIALIAVIVVFVANQCVMMLISIIAMILLITMTIR